MINRNNYHLIEEFLAYELGTRGRTQGTIGRYRSWLRYLLTWADEVPFSEAHKIVPSFGQFIKKSHSSLALESQKKIVETTRVFFRWAKLYHSTAFTKLPPHWINDLTPPTVNRDNNNLEYVKYEEALQLATLPVQETDLALWRDKAAVAMLFLSGARGGAFTTLPISAVHLNSEHPFINQWPELGVHTKKNKKATTFLFKIPELMSVVQKWDAFVRRQCPPTFPWYAPIDAKWGEHTISKKEPGRNREVALAKRIRLLYSIAGLPYKNPHQFRHGYATYGLAHCRTMLEYQALSRNLMHANIAITDKIYAHLEEQERAKILTNLQVNPVCHPNDELNQYLSTLSKDSLIEAITMASKLLAR
jgi:site-specific recombinase XerD